MKRLLEFMHPSVTLIRQSRLLWCSLLALLVLSLAGVPLQAADAPDLFDPKKILESLPRDLVKNMGERSKEERQKAMTEASAKLRTQFNDKTGTLSFKLTRIVQYQGAYNVFSEAEKVRVAGVEVTVYYSIFLGASENSKAARLRVGDKITATGRARDVHMDDTGVLNLRLGIWEASLK